MERRRFLQVGAAGLAGVVVNGGRISQEGSAAARWFCELPGGAPLLAAAASPTFTPFTLALPVPPKATPVSTDRGVDRYEIVQRTATATALPNLTTPVQVYEGSWPGPTILARVGRPVVVAQHNQLDVPVAVHLHGAHVRPGDDGHPIDAIPPGQTREYHYPNGQLAATLWYHDHVMHAAPENVYRGLAAFYLLGDDAEDGLGLPHEYGVDDIPLLLQDRTFNADGSLFYDPTAHNGFTGDTVCVNGVASPFLVVKPAKYRFRIVNGSNFRAYDLTLTAQRANFTLVASDHGLLANSLPSTSQVTLTPAERVEIVVDFASRAGQTVPLRDARSGADILQFRVDSAGGSSAVVPRDLRTIPPATEGAVTRDVVLAQDPSGVWQINGKTFDPARVDFFPRAGTTEVWRVRNDSTFVHPFHIHLVRFRVLDRNGAAPPEAERGWKDTVAVAPNETVRLAATFEGFVGTYVYHCHIFEHAEHAMMAQFCVVELARVAGAGRVETAAALSGRTFAAGGSVPVAYVATAGGFPDALAAGPAAALAGGPVLLTSGGSLPAATAAELDRLRPARIVVLGGTAVVPASVEQELQSHVAQGGRVDRLSGPDRFATAAAVSADAFQPGVPVVYVATGGNFPDALGGGAGAAAEGGPILLVAPDAIPAPTDAELKRLQPKGIVVLGGTSAVSDAVLASLRSYTTGPVDRVAGGDRYETAVAVSSRVFRNVPVETVVLATGTSFPDALAGAPAAAAGHGPLLLVTPGEIPPSVDAELRRLQPRRILLLGGTGAVSPAVEQALNGYLPGP